MQHSIFETLIGAAIIGLAVFFVVLTSASTGKHAINGYSIQASFDRIDGVMAGTDVKISGVKIGSVKATEMNTENYRAKVTLNIKQGLKLPADSSAEVVSESLLGGKYISIVPGLDSESIKPGGEITMTSSSVNFESLISKFLFESSQNSRQNPEAKQS